MMMICIVLVTIVVRLNSQSEPFVEEEAEAPPKVMLISATWKAHQRSERPGRGGILAKLTFETIKEELHKDKVAQKDGLIMQPCFLSRIVTEYEDEDQANNLLYPATKPVAL